MTTQQVPFCTDEELLVELKKLGYNDVAPDVFEMMKDDLSKLVSKEQNNSKSEKESTSSDLKYRYSQRQYRKVFRKSPESENSISPEINQSYEQKFSGGKYVSDTKYVPDSKYENKFSDTLDSCDDSPKIGSFDRYISTFKNYKTNTYSRKHEVVSAENLQELANVTSNSIQDINAETDYTSSTSTTSIDINKIKRKVLRHREGKPIITEEFLDIPSIFNSSYPETQTLDNSKSFSSDDLSWKSNSSTGSMSAVSPDSGSTPRSTFSLSSTRSFNARITNQRKKKNDPVAMYNYYKKFWNEFKPPGEKTHDKLRWAVRDKMLEYNL
ncbi:HYLS1_C domain-containing protein [Trichonephila inaurata madagascariensis]|uniref:HYLS1_C domain-containing protein n=1 Tax=Trichonephila inaurata madagascariensis TaxID=2747483 RepID=A0A8X6Y5A9_9ARAC|nr:HYLS1_C domain-containing protein [Trichonephila inaurata madagascariensis]